mgnify:CR=1 FL=1
MTKYKPDSTVFGIPYHVVPIAMRGFKYAKQLDWCTEVFGECTASHWQEPGPKPWKPNERWYANGDYFWFREEKDAAWFTLRWT